MIPNLGLVTLWRVDVRDPKRWIVKNHFGAAITDVRRNNDDTIRLMSTVRQQSYVCVRSIRLMSLEQLKDSGWSATLSGRSHGHSSSLLVEAVAAFEVSRLLGMGPQQLLLDGAVRTAAIPHQHNAYCGAHDRAHYWEDLCPRCVPARKAA